MFSKYSFPDLLTKRQLCHVTLRSGLPAPHESLSEYTSTIGITYCPSDCSLHLDFVKPPKVAIMSTYSSLFSTAKTRVADPVRVTKAADLTTSHGQTKGMTRQVRIPFNI
jgi:hypothetical protein